jgi:short-subunit dehydrogenase
MEIKKRDFNFKNKVAVVTGAGSGVGKQVAVDLASLGCKLIIVGQDKEKLSKVKNDLSKFNNEVLAISCDVSNRKHVEEMALQIIQKTGKVDILVNAEGYGKWKSFEDSSIEEIEEEMKKNYLGTLYMIKAFFKTLREQEEGYIVNIASMASFVGIPNLSGYCASKSAVLALSESIYNEFKDSRLNVTCVCTGSVENNYFCDQSINEERGKSSINPEKISKEIINAIKSKKFLVVVPKKYRVVLLAKGISTRFTNAQTRKRFAE